MRVADAALRCTPAHVPLPVFVAMTFEPAPGLRSSGLNTEFNGLNYGLVAGQCHARRSQHQHSQRLRCAARLHAAGRRLQPGGRAF